MNTKDFLVQKKLDEAKGRKWPGHLGHIISILFAIILILLGSTEITISGYGIPGNVKLILTAFGQALLVGMVISWSMDLPFMREYFRKSILDLLVGDEYLSSLDKSRLQILRKNCTDRIYIEGTKHFDKSLLELDESITKLLAEPYISNYRCDVVCTKLADGMIQKVISIKTWYTNPSSKKADLEFKAKIWLFSSADRPNVDVFKVTKLKVKIDGNGEDDLTSQVKYTCQANKDSSAGYDLQVSVNKEDGTPFKWEYESSLELEIEDVRLVPEHDNIFIKRISEHPVKSYRINYVVNNMDCKLDGTCFGTLAQVSSGEIRVVRQENSISIESFSWLLPGNGLIIATIPQKK